MVQQVECHCEERSDEAIQGPRRAALDCFVAGARLLAMTMHRLRRRALRPIRMPSSSRAPISESSMVRTAALLLFALTLAACDAVNTVTEGSAHARAVESDLEKTTGMKPQVGFNWRNGHLVSVTVQYPHIVQSQGLYDLAKTVRASVKQEFKQTPGSIVLAFSLGAD
jgi:hypothetical protein